MSRGWSNKTRVEFVGPKLALVYDELHAEAIDVSTSVRTPIEGTVLLVRTDNLRHSPVPRVVVSSRGFTRVVAIPSNEKVAEIETGGVPDCWLLGSRIACRRGARAWLFTCERTTCVGSISPTAVEDPPPEGPEEEGGNPFMSELERRFEQRFRGGSRVFFHNFPLSEGLSGAVMQPTELVARNGDDAQVCNRDTSQCRTFARASGPLVIAYAIDGTTAVVVVGGTIHIVSLARAVAL